ncbi:MAG: ATP-binding protein DrrA1-3 family domain-containing protein, partial [Senegalia sp. (in: firmicutes)]
IIIMDRGKNIVSGTNEELKSMITTTEKIVVGFVDANGELLEKIKNIAHVLDIELKDNDYIIKFENGVNNLSNLIEFIKENNLTYEKLYSRQPTLNDVFLELTGKELRD